MKLKPVYIYLIAFVAVVLVIIISTNLSNEEKSPITSESAMPDDDVHKGLKGGEEPSAGNVTDRAKHQMEMFEKMVTENPDDTAMVKKYADLLSGAHNPQKAIQLYQSILDKDANRIDVMLAKSSAHYSVMQYDIADNLLNKILSLEPNNEEANFNIGAIAAAKGNYSKAKEIWENVIKKFPGTHVAKIAEASLKQLGNSN